MPPIRLLVVEDSRADLDLLEIAFRDAGLPVWFDTVETAGEACARVRDIAAGIEPLPDLVLLDLRLPDQPGELVLREIRSHRELDGVPVVVLTGSATRRMEIQRMGADGYIVKPLRYDELLDVVEELRAYLPDAIA